MSGNARDIQHKDGSIRSVLCNWHRPRAYSMFFIVNVTIINFVIIYSFILKSPSRCPYFSGHGYFIGVFDVFHFPEGTEENRERR
jgi:hypothetical protein